LPDNSVFFADQTEQSKVKAQIVSSYFTAWARVMRNNWTGNMGYIDLFCGPGIYGDNMPAAPLKIIEQVLSDQELSRRMLFVFNDQDSNNIETLKRVIAEADRGNVLKGKIQFLSETVDSEFYRRIRVSSSTPVLSFVDPFGYKGLTMNLINQLIRNNGSDCIFFFNYNRINMALSNTKFDVYLEDIFGVERTQNLKKQLAPLSPAQREPVVLNGLIEALKEGGAKYVLPFKFYSQEMLRTSHFIVFVSKHATACKIMKTIMYANSAKDLDGVAKFSFEDSHNFSGLEQLSLFGKPIQALQDTLLEQYSGKRVMVKEICDRVELDITNHFVGKNVKDVLRKLEAQGVVSVISGRKQKMRNGVLNMPDKALVEFK